MLKKKIHSPHKGLHPVRHAAIATAESHTSVNDVQGNCL